MTSDWWQDAIAPFKRLLEANQSLLSGVNLETKVSRVWTLFNEFPDTKEIKASLLRQMVVATKDEENANNHKEIGNEFYRNGKPTEAVEKYTHALQLGSGAILPLCFANRAAALLQIGKYLRTQCAYVTQ